MTILRLAALAALVLTVGCGGFSARFNPFARPGASKPVQLIPEGGFAPTADSRALVAEVTSATLEPVIGGGVVHATGLPPVQGFWDAELTSTTALEPDDAGILTLDFRIRPPLDPTRVSVPRSREVTVALFISRQKLDRIREIRIAGAQTSRSIRR